MRNLFIAGLALVALVLFFGLRSCTQAQRADHYEQAFKALNDTVRIYRNKQGQAVAAISVLTLDRAALAALDAKQDKQLADLKQVVAADKRVLRAAVFRAEARGRAAGLTRIAPPAHAKALVSSLDTTGQKCPPLPTYTSTVTGDGLTAHITAGPDTVRIDSFTLEQDFAVAYTSKKAGLFAKRTGTVEVTALSPGGAVTAVRAYEVPEATPKRGGWFAAGAGTGAAGLLLLLLLL